MIRFEIGNHRPKEGEGNHSPKRRGSHSFKRHDI